MAHGRISVFWLTEELVGLQKSLAVTFFQRMSVAICTLVTIILRIVPHALHFPVCRFNHTTSPPRHSFLYFFQLGLSSDFFVELLLVRPKFLSLLLTLMSQSSSGGKNIY